MINFILLAMILSTPQQSRECYFKRIIDGDTFICVLKSGDSSMVKLYGIDAPERGQTFGETSRAALRAMLTNSHLRLEDTPTPNSDHYLVVNVYKDDGTFVNENMVRFGYAWCERNTVPSVCEIEKDARAKPMGLWHDTNPIPPWEFRKSNDSVPNVESVPTRKSSSNKVNSIRNTSKVQQQNKSVYKKYITGPKGGCYYVNDNGKKVYVDKSFCL